MIFIPAIYKNNVKYSGSSSSSNIDITTTLTEDTVSDTSVPSSKAVYSIVDNLQTELNNVIDDNNKINNNLSFDGLQPLKEILVVTSGSGSVVLDNDSWIQFNLHGDGTGSNVIGFINNIVIFGFQHISCDTYNSVYAHKGDIVKISVVGNAYGKAYIQ